jgi:predicted ABC-type transport system involved in lysophospholipase L1 biosynthesis ATPase subunit
MSSLVSPLLSLESLSRSFDLFDAPLSILNGVQLELHAGESLSLSGPSGSGKSTFIHLIAGTDTPTGGEVYWRGRSLTELSEAERASWRLREVGLIFQDFRLMPHLNALQNTALPLELLGTPPSQAEALAEMTLREVGLGDRLRHAPHQLSGGEQQRVALARALVHTPALLLADEPTGNLDRQSASQVAELLLSLPKARGTAVLIVTHDLALAEQTDRHLQMREGRLVPMIEV